jgi:2'-5' RNA ligase
MAHYLIEFRLRGFAKRYSQELIKEISRKFRVSGMKDKVSHITLYGPFTTNNEKRMVSEVLSLCRRHNRIYFSIKGVDYFDNPSNKVIYLDINPSEELKVFREKLSLKLRAITSTASKEDSKSKENFKFHSTIAFKDINLKMNQILSHLNNRRHPNIRQTLLRVTILRNGKILNEYDFLQRRLFNRRQSLNKQLWMRTISILKQKSYQQTIKTQSIQPKKKSIWDKIKSFFTKNGHS